jgi:hypothetical protein
MSSQAMLVDSVELVEMETLVEPAALMVRIAIRITVKRAVEAELGESAE